MRKDEADDVAPVIGVRIDHPRSLADEVFDAVSDSLGAFQERTGVSLDVGTQAESSAIRFDPDRPDPDWLDAVLDHLQQALDVRLPGAGLVAAPVSKARWRPDEDRALVAAQVPAWPAGGPTTPADRALVERVPGTWMASIGNEEVGRVEIAGNADGRSFEVAAPYGRSARGTWDVADGAVRLEGRAEDRSTVADFDIRLAVDRDGPTTCVVPTWFDVDGLVVRPPPPVLVERDDGQELHVRLPSGDTLRLLREGTAPAGGGVFVEPAETPGAGNPSTGARTVVEELLPPGADVSVVCLPSGTEAIVAFDPPDGPVAAWTALRSLPRRGLWPMIVESDDMLGYGPDDGDRRGRGTLASEVEERFGRFDTVDQTEPRTSPPALTEVWTVPDGEMDGGIAVVPASTGAEALVALAWEDGNQLPPVLHQEAVAHIEARWRADLAGVDVDALELVVDAPMADADAARAAATFLLGYADEVNGCSAPAELERNLRSSTAWRLWWD